jgi:hypothetical protein
MVDFDFEDPVEKKEEEKKKEEGLYGEDLCEAFDIGEEEKKPVVKLPPVAEGEDTVRFDTPDTQFDDGYQSFAVSKELAEIDKAWYIVSLKFAEIHRVVDSLVIKEKGTFKTEQIEVMRSKLDQLLSVSAEFNDILEGLIDGETRKTDEGG